VKNLFAQTGLEPNQIDLAATHQASHLALKHAARLLRLDKDKMVNIFPSHGNQVGASLPTALHHGIEQHQLKRGAKILLLGSGAGVTLGGMILVY
jgi:3-oxoacyl-[acyl-carrier-protein] synthase-3